MNDLIDPIREKIYILEDMTNQRSIYMYETMLLYC